MSKLVLIIVLCLIIDKCYSQYRPYRRIKRGKYYSSPPQRFYSRPPFSFPAGGIISYTPPPNYRDDEPPYPGTRTKVSKPPTNDGLGEEDINNLVKYLSKQDLDKIVDYANTNTRGHDTNSIEFKPSKYKEFRPSQNDFGELSNHYGKFNDNNNYKTGLDSPETVFNKYSSEYSKVLHQKDDDQFRPILPGSEYSSQKNDYDQNVNFNTFVTEPTAMSVYQVTSPSYPEYTSPKPNNFNNLNSNYQEERSQRYTQPNNYKYSNNPSLNPVGTSGNQQYIEHSNSGSNDIYNVNNNYQDKNSQRYTQPNNYEYSNSILNQGSTSTSQQYTENENRDTVNNLNNNYQEVNNQRYTTQRNNYKYSDPISNQVSTSDSQQYIEDNKSGYNNLNDINNNYQEVNIQKHSQTYNYEYTNPISTTESQQYIRNNTLDGNNLSNNYQDINSQRYKQQNNYEYSNPISTSGSQQYIGSNNPNDNNYQDINNQRYTQKNNYEYSNPTLNQLRMSGDPKYTEENKRYRYSTETENTASTVFPPYDTSNNDKYKFQNNPHYSEDYNNDLTYNKEREENLPKPINLRDETDYEVSYTNKVPSVAKLENYKLENFGSLPLMEYNSKLASANSYSVPHYTVTSPSTYSAPASSSSSSSSYFTPTKSSPLNSLYGNIAPIEKAPPISAARQQSDAHLKATKIWTSRSRGTAYTLHDDGTLSLEKPLPKARPNYGSYGYH